jgi:hypothetical protein
MVYEVEEPVLNETQKDLLNKIERAMLEIMKVPNWHNIPPFEFYLTPL